MEVLTIRPKNNEQLKAIKAVLKALKIPFEKKESPYDPKFVNKVHQSEKEREGTIILNNDEDVDDYFQNLGSDVQD